VKEKLLELLACPACGSVRKASFDIVHSIEVLYHTPDASAAFAKTNLSVSSGA